MSFNSNRIRDRIYPLLILFLGLMRGLEATSSDEDIPIIEDHLCGAPLSPTRDLPIPEETREDEEEEDIPILAEFLCGTLTLDSNSNASSPTPFEDAERQEKKEAFLPQDQPGPRPYTSQILQARHPEGENQVDAINPRRGEGLPYRYTQNLEGLVKDYEHKKWDGRRLNLAFGAYNGAKLNGLFVFRDLVYLDLSGNPLTDEDISRLSTLLHLEILNLKSLSTRTSVTSVNFKSLNQLQQIKHLSLEYNFMRDEDTQALSKSTNLTSLDMNNNFIGVIGAQALSPLTSLTYLNLSNNKIRAEGAQYLSTLRNLTILDLDNNQIGNDGVQALSNLTKLTFLVLVNNGIDDKGLHALAPLAKLTHLNLNENRISDEGSQILAEFTNLMTLNLTGNQIGKKGLQALAMLTNLTFLNLNRIGISSAEKEDLRKQLPKCSIKF